MDDATVAITAVEALGPPARRAQNAPFRTPIRYHLADGTSHDSSFTTKRKKDGLPHAELLNRSAANGGLDATFVDGEFFGTRMTVRLC